MPLWTAVDLLMVSYAVFIVLIGPRRERHALMKGVDASRLGAPWARAMSRWL
jgi:hypothetical protein